MGVVQAVLGRNVPLDARFDRGVDEASGHGFGGLARANGVDDGIGALEGPHQLRIGILVADGVDGDGGRKGGLGALAGEHGDGKGRVGEEDGEDGGADGAAGLRGGCQSCRVRGG